MLQNPETRKKQKNQLRPLAARSLVPVPNFASRCAGGTSMAGMGFELTVTPSCACSSFADRRSLRVEVTCRDGNESHSRRGLSGVNAWLGDDGTSSRRRRSLAWPLGMTMHLAPRDDNEARLMTNGEVQARMESSRRLRRKSATAWTKARTNGWGWSLREVSCG